MTSTWRQSASGGVLQSHLGISRQAISIHMQSLIDAGKVVRSGAARATCCAADRPLPQWSRARC
jgi:hypothetical protein